MEEQKRKELMEGGVEEGMEGKRKMGEEDWEGREEMRRREEYSIRYNIICIIVYIIIVI